MLLVTFTTVQRMTSQFSCQNVALDLLRPRLGIRPLELSTMLTPFCPLSWLRGFPEKFPKQRSLLFECYCLSLLFLFPSSRRCFIPFSPWFHFFSWKWLNSTFIFILSIHVFLDILIERNALSYSRIRIEINISIGNSRFLEKSDLLNKLRNLCAKKWRNCRTVGGESSTRIQKSFRRNFPTKNGDTR